MGCKPCGELLMRYTISLAMPMSSELWRAGAYWLGMEQANGVPQDQPALQGIDAYRFNELTRVARRLGFQAAVKPFFRLSQGVTEQDLCELLDDFSSKQLPITLGSLTIRYQEKKFYLEPETYPSSLISLAAEGIRILDSYGAAPKPSEYARLKAAVLSPQEKQNLELWGYPYVFNQYRFRFLLTSRVTDTVEKEVIYSALVRLFSTIIATPLMINALSLFIENGAGQPMRLIKRFEFSSHPFNKEDSVTNDNPTSQELYS